jgi:hypothetical protein
MDSLNPRARVAEILPGFTVISAFIAAYLQANTTQLERLINASGGVIAAVGFLILFIVSWIIGTFFDAVRNLLENCEIDWRFFFAGDMHKVDQLDKYYFAYYALGANFVIGISLFFIFQIIIRFDAGLGLQSTFQFSHLVNEALFILASVFLFDASSLRKEVVDLLNDDGK